jgi:hypothetical protein
MSFALTVSLLDTMSDELHESVELSNRPSVRNSIMGIGTTQMHGFSLYDIAISVSFYPDESAK